MSTKVFVDIKFCELIIISLNLFPTFGFMSSIFHSLSHSAHTTEGQTTEGQGQSDHDGDNTHAHSQQEPEHASAQADSSAKSATTHSFTLTHLHLPFHLLSHNHQSETQPSLESNVDNLSTSSLPLIASSCQFCGSPLHRQYPGHSDCSENLFLDDNDSPYCSPYTCARGDDIDEPECVGTLPVEEEEGASMKGHHKLHGGHIARMHRPVLPKGVSYPYPHQPPWM